MKSVLLSTIVALLLLSLSGLAVADNIVVEDAEDGETTGWSLFDNTPAGATVENVSDSTYPTNYIRFNSTGRDNSFIFGDRTGIGGLAIVDRNFMGLRLRSDSAFAMYVYVQTDDGIRYLLYNNSNSDRLSISNRVIHHGVGSSTVSGTWATISRDLNSDLQDAEPTNNVQSISGVLISGSIDLDDISFSDAPINLPNFSPVAITTPNQTISLGQSVTLDGSQSYDIDGLIVDYLWIDEQGNNIANSKTASWTPTSSGTSTITLLVTDNDGGQTNSSLDITVEDNLPSLITVENAEDGEIDRWVIFDNTPAGANIENLSDESYPNNFIRFTSTGRNNSFLIGNRTGIGGLDIIERPFMSLRLRSSSAFAIYVYVNTDNGIKHLLYNNNSSDRLSISTRVIHHGLGRDTTSGEWVSIQRDLNSDLRDAEPTNTIRSISGFLIAGSVDLDELSFSDSSHGLPNLPPIANAAAVQTIGLGQSVVLDGSQSFDPDGSIDEFVWTNDQGNTIANGETATWTPTEPGTHTIRLTVTDNNGDVNFTNISVTVSASQIDLSEYSVVFADNFNGTSLNSSKWNTGLLWGPYLPINNEEQLYVDTLGINSNSQQSPFNFTGSALEITATATSNSNPVPARPDEGATIWGDYPEYRFNDDFNPDDVNYLSGIITSYDSFKMTHGYVEIRAKLPEGRGLWPAFWLLNTHYVEDSPEIDVMEFLGQNKDEVYHTYHYFDISDNWRKISTPTYVTKGDSWTEQFHTYGMRWNPNSITWFVDGLETKTISNDQFKMPSQAMYLIANLAVGGDWPGSPDATTALPAKYEIDYIRAYKKDIEEPLDLDEDFELVFSDGFSGPDLNPLKWNTRYLWGPYLAINNEEQYYVDSNGIDSDKSYSPFSFHDQQGVEYLSINAKPDNQSGPSLPPSSLPDPGDDIWTNNPEFQQGPYTKPPYTSGVITSYDAFKFVNGYAEIRARVPEGDGLWPAFWLLNAYYVGPLPEIDVMEILGENTNVVYHSYHRSDTNGVQKSTQFTSNTPNGATKFSDDFHRFGVHWQPGKITWYVDGVPVHTYEEPNSKNNDAYQLMYVIANLAVGGNFNTVPTDPSSLPASLDIDYIKVYQVK